MIKRTLFPLLISCLNILVPLSAESPFTLTSQPPIHIQIAPKTDEGIEYFSMSGAAIMEGESIPNLKTGQVILTQYTVLNRKTDTLINPLIQKTTADRAPGNPSGVFFERTRIVGTNCLYSDYD